MNATAVPPASATEPAPSAVQRLLVGLLAVLPLLTPYLFDADDGSAGNELVGDGYLLVTQHEVLTGIQAGERSLADCLTATWWGNIHPDQPLYRPLSTLVLGISGALSGPYLRMSPDGAMGPGDAPVPYHLFAIALKAISALLVLELGWVLLRSRIMAMCAAALFATLPVHGEAVFDVAGVAELLCCALSLGAWIAWVRAGDRPLSRPADLATAVGLLFAATLAKESAFALPLVFFLTDVGRAPAGGFGAGLRHALGKLPALALCALALGASFGLRVSVAGAIFPEFTALNSLDNPLLFEGPLTRVANALRVTAGGILAMVGLNLLSSGVLNPAQWDASRGVGPFPYSADYSPSQIEVLGPFSPWNLLGILFVLGSIVLAVVLFRRCRTRAALWLSVFAAMTVTANVLFAIGTIHAERLLLFPSVALVLFLGVTLGRRGTVGVGAALLLATGGGVWTWARADDWSSNNTLWRHTYQQSSKRSARAHYNAGVSLLEQRIPSLARQRFEEAVQLFPGYADAHAQLGIVLQTEFRVDEAVQEYREATELRLEAQEWNYIPVRQQPILGVANLLDLTTRARDYQGDIELLKEHAEWLESLLDRGYASPVAGQKLGETYRILRRKTPEPDLRATYDTLAVAAFERGLAIEPTAVGLRSFADYLEERGDPESIARARALYAEMPEEANETERALLVLAESWHRLDESPDTVLRDMEELLARQRERGILTQEQHFEAKLLQSLAEVDLFERDPTDPQAQLRRIKAHLSAAIALRPVLTPKTQLVQVAFVQVLVRLGELEEARLALESMLLSDQQDLGPQPALRTLLGQVYERLGRTEDAREAFERAAGDLVLEDGTYVERVTLRDARQGLMNAVSALDGDEAVDALLSEWNAAAPGGRDELALFLEALRAAARGDLAGALEHLRLVEAEFPDTAGTDPVVAAWRAELEALSALNASFDPAATPLPEAYDQASRRLGVRDFAGARTIAEAILLRDLPDQDRAGWLDVLATSLASLGDSQGALDALDQALELEQVEPDYRLFLQRHKAAVEAAASASAGE